MVEVSQFKDAMAQLASAVHIVTTSGETGQHGFTASAVCSVTDSPPTLLVCVNSNARAYEHFIKNRVLMVNTLTAEQSSLSNVFASSLSQEERFANACWTTLTTGSPMLQDALINFDCEITEIKHVGTHDILICKIVDIRQSDKKEALVYHNRSYHILK